MSPISSCCLLTLVISALQLLPVMSVQADSSAETTLRLCYEDDNYPPYTFGTAQRRENPQRPGILPELIRQAADRVGLRTEFVSRPWKRCIRNFRSGETDAIFATIWESDRDDWGRFPGNAGGIDNSRSLWLVRYPIYIHSQSALGWDGNRFTNLASGLSAPLGYVAEKHLRKAGAFSGQAYSPEEGMKLLSMGRLDGYVAEESIIDILIRTRGYEQQITRLPIPFFTAHWHVPLSHRWYQKHPDLAERFWDAIRAARLRSADTLWQSYVSP